MLSLSKYFPSPKIVALTSDISVDFTLDKESPALTQAQKEHLSFYCEHPIDQIAWAEQVHGKEVITVDQEYMHPHILPQADALITNQLNTPIAVRTADCLPIFVFDPNRWITGVIHAGWKGTVQGVASHTLSLMNKTWGSWMGDLIVVFGPAIHNCCYKVGEEFLKNFPQDTMVKDDAFYFDLIQANRRQILAMDVPPQNIFDCGICTCCDQRYFSYRRQKERAGRMISLIMLKR